MTIEAYDQERTKDLETIGSRVVRVCNNDLLKKIQDVNEHI